MDRAHLLTIASLAFLLGAVATSTGCVDAEDAVVLPPTPSVAYRIDDVGITTGCDAAGGTQPPAGRMRGLVYVVPTDTRRLPDFEALTPLGAICVDRLGVTERRSFPGIGDRAEWLAVDFQGAFTVETPGTYHFRLTSDDGSRLYIDGTQVLDEDGFHVTRSKEATVALSAGEHRIDVPYWQGPGPLSLVLESATGGGAFHVFELDQPLRDGGQNENKDAS